MGIIRLTLIAAALIWLAMYYFGRDEGLPEDRLGRAPTPAEAEAASAVEIAPQAEAIATPEATEPAAEEAPEAVADTPAAPAEPVPAAEPTPEPAAEPETAPAAEPTPAPQPEPEITLYVSGRVVNVRSGPSTSFDAITSLQRGAPVIDLGEVSDGWRRIRLPSGDFGYMSGDFLSPDPQ